MRKSKSDILPLFVQQQKETDNKPINYCFMQQLK